MLEQKLIQQLRTGDEVLHYFILSKIEKKIAKNNSEFLNLEFKDKSGTVTGKIWQEANNIFNQLSNKNIVKVKGIIEEFNSQKQIKIDKVRNLTSEENIAIEDLLPKSERPIEEMIAEFEQWKNEIHNKFLSKLLDSIFVPEIFNKYSLVPAGKAWHHAYIHGLIEHTLEILKICNLTCTFHPEINKDLLLTGAILHDFGKIEELSSQPNFDYTTTGKLLGHIVIAANIISDKIKNISGFPNELRDQLLHLVLSHQGKLEFASPVLPKTLEAIVLYQADELSAKSNAYKNAIKAESGSESGWTKFIHLAGTSLYFPPENITDDEIKNSLFE